MSDPRNVAHDKKVIQEKKHEGVETEPDGAAAQPGKKSAKQHHAPKTDAAASSEETAPAAAAPVPSATVEGSKVVLATLKDMEHHSRANIEHLAKLMLTVEDELKQKAFSGPLGDVYSAQDAFQTKITALIEAYKAEVDRHQGATA